MVASLILSPQLCPNPTGNKKWKLFNIVSDT
nr:MAG TPA: cuticle protein [Bacteriophage sp.]